MTQIGILSDTHGFIDPRVFTYFKDVDEIWHAGDIGNEQVMDELLAFKPVRAVYGNIDGSVLRMRHPRFQLFMVEKVKVLIIHIGGHPRKYEPGIAAMLKEHKPTIFVTGHSHILKVIYDKNYSLLHINPGAAGNHGFHQVKTLIKFKIEGDKPYDLEVLEIPRNE